MDRRRQLWRKESTKQPIKVCHLEYARVRVLLWQKVLMRWTKKQIREVEEREAC